MCTVPNGTFFFSFFLKVFFLVDFAGAFAISFPPRTTGTKRPVRLFPSASDYVLAADFFLFAIVPLRGPLRVRALVWVRWPRTGRPRRGGRAPEEWISIMGVMFLPVFFRGLRS